jgi:predicted metal-binding membrane protein
VIAAVQKAEKFVSGKTDSSVRSAILLVVVLLSLSAWTITYYQSANMGVLMQLGVPMSLAMEGRADPRSLAAFAGIWLAMMVAMMLPSTYPILLLYQTVARSRTRRPGLGTLLFGASYFLAWTVTGLLFYGAYVLAGTIRTSFSGGNITVLRGAAVFLIFAGIYQWSPLKRACLQHCQSPFDFISEHWHDGLPGALIMGLQQGLYCFGCCWGLMAALAVLGIMHLGWMAAIGAVILLEKFLPSQSWIARISGALFIVAGVLVFAFPWILRWLSADVTIASL